MGKRIYRDIAINGIVYADANAAAEALGVTPQTVRKAIQKDTTHRIGSRIVGAEPMPVWIRGQDFTSAKDAAAHFGVTTGAVYRAINEGRAERFLLPRRGGARSKPVTVAGRKFPSMAEASRALGFSQTYISRVLRNGSVASIQRVIEAAEHKLKPRQPSYFAHGNTRDGFAA